MLRRCVPRAAAPTTSVSRHGQRLRLRAGVTPRGGLGVCSRVATDRGAGTAPAAWAAVSDGVDRLDERGAAGHDASSAGTGTVDAEHGGLDTHGPSGAQEVPGGTPGDCAAGHAVRKRPPHASGAVDTGHAVAHGEEVGAVCGRHTAAATTAETRNVDVDTHEEAWADEWAWPLSAESVDGIDAFFGVPAEGGVGGGPRGAEVQREGTAAADAARTFRRVAQAGRHDVVWAPVGEAAALCQLRKLIQRLLGPRRERQHYLRSAQQRAEAAESLVNELDQLKMEGHEIGPLCYERAAWFVGVVCRDFATAVALADEAVAREVPVAEGLALALTRAAAVHIRAPAGSAPPIPHERVFAAVWNVVIAGRIALSPSYAYRYLAVLLAEKVSEECMLVNFQYLQRNNLVALDADGGPASEACTERVYSILWASVVSGRAYEWVKYCVAREEVRETAALVRTQMRAAGRAGLAAEVERLFYERLPAVMGTPATEVEYTALFSALAHGGDPRTLAAVLAELRRGGIRMSVPTANRWAQVVIKHITSDSRRAEALITEIEAHARCGPAGSDT